MKTELTKEMEERFLKEFACMGTFICPEVGLNIIRYGFPKRYYRSVKFTELEMLDKGWTPTWHINTEIVDILTWQNRNKIWKCYELKISYNDFKSTASKTFVGNYNYYVVPDTLVERIKDEVPKGIGIYVYSTEKKDWRYWENRYTCYRKAKKQELGCSEDCLYYGMIKSLYRDKEKYRNKLK